MAAGSIVRLKVEHFMTYDSVEFEPCPGLNLITGPNGSGKSSLLCAMCLGLGGKPSHIGRSDRVSDFIKNGYSEAYIEIELLNLGGENIVIGRQINDANNSSWTLNGKSSSQKAVDREVAKFNIQTNNLCQFLPQEKVSDFTKMNAKELLESTEQAVGDQSMFANHNKLKELTAEYDEAQSTLKNLKVNLEKEVESNKRLEGQVKQLKELERHMQRMKLIKKKIPWLKYDKSRAKREEKLEKKKAINEKIKIVSNKLEPLRNEVKAAKIRLRVIEKKNGSLDSNIHEKRKELYDSNNKLEMLDSEYMDKKSEIEGKISREKDRTSKIHDIRFLIASLEQQCQNGEAENAHLMVDLGRVNEQLKIKSAENSGISFQLEQSKAKINMLHMELKGIQTTLEKFQHEQEYRLTYLKRREPDVYKAVMWLRQNRNMFKKPIYEPILTLLNIPEPQSVKYIENHIAYRDLIAFYAEDADDMNKFLQILSDEQKLKINGIQAVPVPEVQLQPRCSKDELRNFGLTHYLKELFTAPPLVMNYLCKQYGLHNIPVGYIYDSKMVRRILEDRQFPFHKFFVGDFVFKIKVSKYGRHNKSSGSQKIMDKGLLRVSGNTSEITAYENRKQELLNNSKVESASLERVTEFRKQHEKGIENFKQRKIELQGKINLYKNLHARLKAKKEQLSYAQKPICDIEAEEHMLRNLRDESVLQKETLLIVQQTLYEEIFAMENEKLWNLISYNFAVMVTGKAEETLRNASGELHTLQELLQETSSAIIGLNNEVKRLQNEAKAIVDLTESSALPGSLRDEILEKFKELPQEIEELENELAREAAKVNCLHHANPNILKEYNNREQLIMAAKDTIEVKEKTLKDLEVQISEVRDLWLPKIESLIEQISANFSRYFASLGCAGEVILDKTNNPNDYSKYGLSIQVKFRDDEPLNQLSNAHHSGGECSVSTILFILSLQELTEVPFRVVDEINQGMDNINERSVFNLIAKSSCSKKKSQYFLITPKLLPNLVYPSEMQIVVAFNGLSNLDKWYFDKSSR